MLSGWGVKFFDYDNDGNMDLFLCNGHPDLMVEQRLQNVGFRAEVGKVSGQSQRFHDRGPGCFIEALHHATIRLLARARSSAQKKEAARRRPLGVSHYPR